MPKNIILCSDGTGNRGGTTPASNVYEMYEAIELHDDAHPQVKFYDNGVGTETNKLLRGLAGAFGFGFKANVRDLYDYLARHYEPGDKVFLFGFSRGAATVRAFSGFVAAAGLVDGRKLTRKLLDKRIDRAFTVYRKAEKDPARAAEHRQADECHGAVPITFLGVWDTVSALGFPQEWNITGLGMWVLNGLFIALDHVSDWFLPHRFYNYDLTDNVVAAYQALAIDDERKSFKPLVWKEPAENKSPAVDVDQVWFAGAHANVGGGYRRAGMATVPLEWIMTRASHLGLVYKAGVLDKVHADTNVHGRLYDSRDGVAVYYRYHPRNIEALCRDKIQGNIRVHRSVMDRLERHTGFYAPGQLPAAFDVVETPIGAGTQNVAATGLPWKAARAKVNRWVFRRKWLYGVFLEFTLVVLLAAGWFWIKPPTPTATQDVAWTLDWLLAHLANALNYVLPVAFEGLVTVAVIQHPWIFGAAVLFVLGLVVLRSRFRTKHADAREEMRHAVLETMSTPVAAPQVAAAETV